MKTNFMKFRTNACILANWYEQNWEVIPLAALYCVLSICHGLAHSEAIRFWYFSQAQNTVIGLTLAITAVLIALKCFGVYKCKAPLLVCAAIFLISAGCFKSLFSDRIYNENQIFLSTGDWFSFLFFEILCRAAVLWYVNKTILYRQKLKLCDECTADAIGSGMSMIFLDVLMVLDVMLLREAAMAMLLVPCIWGIKGMCKKQQLPSEKRKI